jgi:hypothetical protein
MHKSELEVGVKVRRGLELSFARSVTLESGTPEITVFLRECHWQRDGKPYGERTRVPRPGLQADSQK